MWGGINRRRFPRVRYKTTIYLQKKGTQKKIDAYTENISSGGMCITSEEEIGLFQGVNLELELGKGDANRIKCSGTAVWVVKKHGTKRGEPIQYDIGLEFVDLDQKNIERLEKIVSDHLKK